MLCIQICAQPHTSYNIIVLQYMYSVPFQHEGIQVTLTESPRSKPDDLKSLQFGKVFSDHMLLANWTKADGWAVPKIVPYGDLSLSPALSALHYSTEVLYTVTHICINFDYVRMTATTSITGILSLLPHCFSSLQCFEGLKAYKGDDGKIRLFRPMENMKRLLRSAIAASLPVSINVYTDKINY